MLAAVYAAVMNPWAFGRPSCIILLIPRINGLRKSRWEGSHSPARDIAPLRYDGPRKSKRQWVQLYSFTPVRLWNAANYQLFSLLVVFYDLLLERHTVRVVRVQHIDPIAGHHCGIEKKPREAIIHCPL